MEVCLILDKCSTVFNLFFLGETGEYTQFYFFDPLSNSHLQFINTSKFNGAIRILAWVCKAAVFF